MSGAILAGERCRGIFVTLGENVSNANKGRGGLTTDDYNHIRSQ